MININKLAYFGAKPRLKHQLHVAQINLPSWEKVEKSIRGIFKRRYFTNHGPLVDQFESEFAAYLGVNHAVCMANGTIALMVMYKALKLTGEVIVPSYTFPATVQALSWAGIKPVLCDVNPKTQIPTAENIKKCLTHKTTGIILTHVWGRCACTPAIKAIAEKYGLSLAFDACHGIGCVENEKKIGSFGNAEAFSFHATKIINASEGGCVTTNNEALALSLKTMRSFQQLKNDSRNVLRINAKMSEGQAALAILSLQDLPKNISANRDRYNIYKKILSGIRGLRLDTYSPNQNNYQYVNVLIDESRLGISRDKIFDLLKAENIICRRHFMPGMHRTMPYSLKYQKQNIRFPGTDWLCQRILQLPNGQDCKKSDILKICEVLHEIILLAPQITHTGKI